MFQRTNKPPEDEGLAIMGWRVCCSSAPNFAAVFGMSGMEARKIFSK